MLIYESYNTKLSFTDYSINFVEILFDFAKNFLKIHFYFYFYFRIF